MEGATIESGEAYLDNFKIVEGALTTPTTYQLTVDSSPDAGVPIELDIEYNGGPHDGTTPFMRAYDEDIPVGLTAPADDGGGNKKLPNSWLWSL